MNEFDTAYNKDLTNSFNYRLLSRLQSDCKYYLGHGNKCEKHLWAGNVTDQIAKMKELYNKLPEKPEWCTWEDICNYEKEMIPMPVETVIEEEFTNDDLALIVEQCDVVNESLGKWAKNVFTKFGKKSVQAELKKTIQNFCSVYKFQRFDEDKPKTYGKIEAGYLITVKFNLTDWKRAVVLLNVISSKSKKPVEDFKNVEIPIKHSNTEEEIAKKINGELSEIDIQITTNQGKIPADFFNKNNTNSIADNTAKYNETIGKVAKASGFETKVFQEKLNDVDGDKQKKITVIKSLISGWKKLDENERKLFQQLQN